MQKPDELRQGYSTDYVNERVIFYALFFEEPTEIPLGWHRESTTHYLSDGRAAIAYSKYFPWNARIVNQHITYI